MPFKHIKTKIITKNICLQIADYKAIIRICKYFFKKSVFFLVFSLSERNYICSFVPIVYRIITKRILNIN